MDNDIRGWIMTCMSAVACMLGASVVCIDVIVRLLPGKKNFKIQDSDAFLSCSLCLSAGVMLFSALNNMLSSSKTSLISGGLSPKNAAWVLICCFMGGVVGIQLLSSILHRFMPSHVVRCDHTHNETEERNSTSQNSHVRPDHNHAHTSRDHRRHKDPSQQARSESHHSQSLESTPLLTQRVEHDELKRNRPKLSTLSQHLSFVLGTKSKCEVEGFCFGYSDRCGEECFKKVSSRNATRSFGTRAEGRSLRPHALLNNDADDQLDFEAAQARNSRSPCPSHDASAASSSDNDTDMSQEFPSSDLHDESKYPDLESHHHHVPENAFLSIGLQTSIAIALHKLPEGFITYATNHANPKLGVSIFLALFIHNISEGFALALPLFLAMNSRLKALLVSIVLGGLSQPLGAGVAAAWLAVVERHRGDDSVSDAVYGAMFSVTAGIMAAVAISLLQEGFDLTHNKRLCIAFTFIGMGLLGISSALTS